MASRHPHVKALRAVLSGLCNLYVRRWPDGDLWVGRTNADRNKWGFQELREKLNSKGILFECNGKPGTEGEFIIEIKPSEAQRLVEQT